MKLAHEHGYKVEEHYSDEDYQLMLKEENIAVLREDEWLDDVFGPQGRLNKQWWIEKVTEKGKWIFSASGLRKRVIKQADLDMRY